MVKLILLNKMQFEIVFPLYGQKIDSQPAMLEGNRNKNEILPKTTVGLNVYLPSRLSKSGSYV